MPDAVSQTEATAWLDQIDHAERRAEKWNKRCDKIEKRYRDERGDDDTAAGGRRMNLLWSNVQTLQPCLYGREPIPIAERRFLDKDVTGRVASQILERSLRYEMGFCGFHDTLEQVVLDYLLCARGVAWLRYVPVFGPASSLELRGDDQLPTDDGEPLDHQSVNQGVEAQEPATKLLGASVEVDYVNRKDFLHSKARTWKEVEWISRRIFMGRKDLCERFGDKVGKAIPLEADKAGSDGSSSVDKTPDDLKKAIVYEIWSKPKRCVYFVAKGYDEFLADPDDDPLSMEDFWPCPKPLFGTLTSNTLEPVPDYAQYQDQAQEIDHLTNRIDQLTKALRIAGCYDAANKELGRLLDEGYENKLIPVASWAAFSQKGGLTGAVSILPVKEVADTVAALTETRKQLKEDLYEVTGLADVIRGQSDPRETAEAVKTKGRFGSMRLQSRQKEVARFCRDIIRMMGEIVAEHFPAEALMQVSGVMYDEGVGPEMPEKPAPVATLPPGPPSIAHPASLPPSGMNGAGPGLPAPPAPPPPDPMKVYQQAYAAAMQEKMALIQSAIDLLRQDKLRGFRIDIETDSTIADNAAEERADRISFLGALSSYLKEAVPAGQQNPQMVPLLCKMLSFGVRGFRVGRDLESSIDEFIDQMEKAAKKAVDNPAPPPPNPEMIKAQAAAEKIKGEIAAQQIEAQSEAQNAQMALQGKQLDFQIAQMKAGNDRAQAERDHAFSMAEHVLRMDELRMKQEMVAAQHEVKMREIKENRSAAGQR